MTNSKIHHEEVDWLIVLACSSDIPELKEEAIAKLMEYGLTQEQIEERYTNLDSNEAQKVAFDKAYRKQVERNEFESYTRREKIGIFFYGPFKVFRQFNTGLKELYTDNYKTMFWQRLLLLLAGTLFWFLFFYPFF